MQEAILKQKQVVDVPELNSYLDLLAEKFVYAFRNSETVTEDERNVVRQMLNLIKVRYPIEEINKSVKREINACMLNNSVYKEHFDLITDYLDEEKNLKVFRDMADTIQRKDGQGIGAKTTAEVILAVDILYENVLDTINRLVKIVENKAGVVENSFLKNLADEVHLYRIKSEIILNAADYGVPQNRTRVVFIGCRKDQELITEIPATVSENEKVTVAEALDDLLFVKNKQLNEYQAILFVNYENKMNYITYDNVETYLLKVKDKNVEKIDVKELKKLVKTQKLTARNDAEISKYSMPMIKLDDEIQN